MPPLLRSVTFRCDRFETRTPPPGAINPTCFGQDVAAWLRAALPPALEPGEPIAEDYGWESGPAPGRTRTGSPSD